MGHQKFETNFINDNRLRQAIFSRHRDGIFKKANALAKKCNVRVAVSAISPTSRPYTFGSPCFHEVVARFQNPEVGRLEKELEQFKEEEEVLRKRLHENLQNYQMKETVDPKLEDLVALKRKLETYQPDLTRKHEEMEVVSSPLILSKNMNKPKKKKEAKFSSGQSSHSKRTKYGLRPVTPRNYGE